MCLNGTLRPKDVDVGHRQRLAAMLTSLAPGQNTNLGPPQQPLSQQ
jgi:hypothetical protein